MDQKQSFNLNIDFLGGFTSIFLKLFFVIIAVFLIVLILNFLRDKFINKSTDMRKDNISDLHISQLTNHGGLGTINFRADRDYLTFGIILIFLGIGFRDGNSALKND